VMMVRFWTLPFLVAGMNALFLYVASELLRPVAHRSVAIFVEQPETGYRPVLMSFAELALFWLMAYGLYVKKAFLKVYKNRRSSYSCSVSDPHRKKDSFDCMWTRSGPVLRTGANRRLAVTSSSASRRPAGRGPAGRRRFGRCRRGRCLPRRRPRRPGHPGWRRP